MTRLTVPELRARKGKEKIVAITAYTAPFARIADAHADILLVGDSLGMVLYGMESTLSVTLDMMILHGRAVAQASTHACVVVDLPFGSYQASPAQAFATAARVMAETGCAAVKLEGGAEMAETIAFLVARGIPVMGHVGLMPQRVHAYGGYRHRGREEEDAARIGADARAVAEAGAFSLVLEAVREGLAREVAAEVEIPVIGIGASPACDGQVLVLEDMAGLTDTPARFVKRYAELGTALNGAVSAYALEVRAGAFPAAEHCYTASTFGKPHEKV